MSICDWGPNDHAVFSDRGVRASIFRCDRVSYYFWSHSRHVSGRVHNSNQADVHGRASLSSAKCSFGSS